MELRLQSFAVKLKGTGLKKDHQLSPTCPRIVARIGVGRRGLSGAIRDSFAFQNETEQPRSEAGALDTARYPRTETNRPLSERAGSVSKEIAA